MICRGVKQGSNEFWGFSMKDSVGMLAPTISSIFSIRFQDGFNPRMEVSRDDANNSYWAAWKLGKRNNRAIHDLNIPLTS